MCVSLGLYFCVVCSIGICIWYAFRGILCGCDWVIEYSWCYANSLIYHVSWMWVWGFRVVLLGSNELVFKWDENSIIKHDFDVLVPLHCVGNVWLVFWYDFGEVCTWTDSKPCTSRPSGSISPKRELQSLTLSSGSWFSPRRPRRGLSDMVSRSGERHSPKRGRGENLRV